MDTSTTLGKLWSNSTARFTRKQLIAIGAAILAAVIVLVSIVVIRSQTGAALATQPIVQQTLVQTVSASGTVNPQNTITVGSQVSGNISALYVDFNSKVKKGQVLAKIDPSTLQAQLDQANAALAQAQAQEAAQVGTADAATASITAASAGNAAQTATARASAAAIASAAATVAKSQSAVQLAQTTLTRDQSLYSQGYMARSQVQTDQDNLVQAQTGLESAQASLTQMRAQSAASTSQTAQTAAQTLVAQGQSASASNLAQADAAAVQSAQAQVQQDQLAVEHAIITSPVDGTVIDREISIGQTVAAGFQAPTLFTIAQNLHKMEVDIAVGEPDIGSIKAGQKVTFTVLAYPNDTFSGVVTQVRDNPTTVSNVVTYTVITQVNNDSGKLLPGMTATASIQIANAPNALVVPLAALQWHPTSSGRHRKAQATPSAAANASPWGQAAGSSAAAVTTGGSGVVFVQSSGGFGSGGITPVPVKILLVAGTQAAVAPQPGKTLNVGDAVVIGNAATAATQPSGTQGISGMGRALH